MNADDITRARTLIAQATEDDRRMTPAPWAKFGPWPYVTIYRDQGDDDSIEPEHVCDIFRPADSTKPPPDESLAEADAISRTRNNLAAIAAGWAAALDEIERLQAKPTSAALAQGVTDARHDAHDAAAEVVAERDAWRPVVQAAERLADASRSSKFARRRSVKQRIEDVTAAVVALRQARKEAE